MKCRKRQVRYRGKTDEIQRETVRCAVRKEEETARLHMARQAPCVICLFLCQKKTGKAWLDIFLFDIFSLWIKRE